MTSHAQVLAYLVIALTAFSFRPAATLTPSPLPSPTVTTASLPSLTSKPLSSNKLGIHLLLDDGRNTWPVTLWSQHLYYARELVGESGYVTELIRLDDLDPARWQTFLDLCDQLHSPAYPSPGNYLQP